MLDRTVLVLLFSIDADCWIMAGMATKSFLSMSGCKNDTYNKSTSPLDDLQMREHRKNPH
jgi:hypothetical protein